MSQTKIIDQTEDEKSRCPVCGKKIIIKVNLGFGSETKKICGCTRFFQNSPATSGWGK